MPGLVGISVVASCPPAGDVPREEMGLVSPLDLSAGCTYPGWLDTEDSGKPCAVRVGETPSEAAPRAKGAVVSRAGAASATAQLVPSWF